MTTDLKKELREAVIHYEECISYLENGNLIHPVGEDAKIATAAFLDKLKRHKADAEQFLASLAGA